MITYLPPPSSRLPSVDLTTPMSIVYRVKDEFGIIQTFHKIREYQKIHWVEEDSLCLIYL